MARRGWLAVLGGALLASVMGCGSSDEQGLDSTGPSLAASERGVLGTGEAEFEAIDGEPRLPLVAGVQACRHSTRSGLATAHGSPPALLNLRWRIAVCHARTPALRFSAGVRRER